MVRLAGSLIDDRQCQQQRRDTGWLDCDAGRTVAPCRDVLALTVGQGASIPGQASRWYVAGKDVPSNVVWVCPSARHWSLQASGCLLGGLSWINEVRDRGCDSHRWHARAAMACSEGDSEANGGLTLTTAFCRP